MKRQNDVNFFKIVWRRPLRVIPICMLFLVFGTVNNPMKVIIMHHVMRLSLSHEIPPPQLGAKSGLVGYLTREYHYRTRHLPSLGHYLTSTTCARKL